MSEANVNKKRKNRWAFPLGLVITVFAVIGLVCVILAGVNATKKAVIKSKNIDEYNTMLTPVVMNDPDPFDDITKANKNQLIDISVWSILKSNLSPDKYEYGEDGMIIPEEDVTAEFHKLFGTDTEPEHATVNGYGYTFTYDSAKHTYSIPLTGIVPTYTPDVIKVQKKSGAVVLTVGYLAGYGGSRARQIYENHFKGKRRQLLYKFNSGYIFARDGNHRRSARHRGADRSTRNHLFRRGCE